MPIILRNLTHSLLTPLTSLTSFPKIFISSDSCFLSIPPLSLEIITVCFLFLHSHARTLLVEDSLRFFLFKPLASRFTVQDPGGPFCSQTKRQRQSRGYGRRSNFDDYIIIYLFLHSLVAMTTLRYNLHVHTI